VRNTTSELADRVEFLRVVKFALDFARRGNTVKNQRPAVDGAGAIMQRAAADHEVNWFAAAGTAHDDFEAIKLFAAQRPRRQPFVQGKVRQSVGSIRDVLGPQFGDGHPPAVVQKSLGRGIEENYLTGVVHDEHCLRHAGKRAIED